MAKTKFFTELATGGSAGGASKEEMERGYTADDPDANEVSEEFYETFFMGHEGGGGFVGRSKGSER